MGAKLIIVNSFPYPPSLILFTYNTSYNINNLTILNIKLIAPRNIKIVCL